MITFRIVLFVAAIGLGTVLVRNTTDMLTCMSQGTHCPEAPAGPSR
jgi:hypothetical protein